MALIQALLLLYAAASLLFAAGLLLALRNRLRGGGDPGTLPFFSVVLPARNEEARIRETLESLAAEDYPRDLFEVIVVDDRSTDRTAAIAAGAGRAFLKFGLLTLRDANPSLHGKQNALHEGIRAARGEYVVLIDADCAFSGDHLRAYARAFNSGAALAFGRTAVAPVHSPQELFEAADLLYLFTVARAAAALHLPLSCMGNNMGIRKADYLGLGGYPALGPSLVEDCQLLSAFRRAGKRIAFVDAQNPLVRTAATGSVNGFVLQRIRWARSLLRFEPALQAAGLVAGLANVSILPLLALWFFGESTPALRLILLKAGTDFFLLSAGAVFFRDLRLLAGFPLFWSWWILSPWILPLGLIRVSGRRWK